MVCQRRHSTHPLIRGEMLMPVLNSPVGLANRPGKNPSLDTSVHKTSLRLYEALIFGTIYVDAPYNQVFPKT